MPASQSGESQKTHPPIMMSGNQGLMRTAAAPNRRDMVDKALTNLRQDFRQISFQPDLVL